MLMIPCVVVIKYMWANIYVFLSIAQGIIIARHAMMTIYL